MHANQTKNRMKIRHRRVEKVKISDCVGCAFLTVSLPRLILYN